MQEIKLGEFEVKSIRLVFGAFSHFSFGAFSHFNELGHIRLLRRLEHFIGHLRHVPTRFIAYRGRAIRGPKCNIGKWCRSYCSMRLALLLHD